MGFVNAVPQDIQNSDGNSTNWRVWLVILLLALLFHLLVFMTHIRWNDIGAPPRIEIKQVDTAKLDEIRKKWRERDKQLLLNKDKSQDKAKEKPPDARYYSDRNIHVDKEQRAREFETVPKAGHPGAKVEPAPKPRTAPEKKEAPSRLKDLGHLGIPFNLNSKQPQKAQENDTDHMRQNEQQAGQSGANQYMQDDKLPEGSENMLNAEESVYYSFYARLYEAIGPVWASKLHSIGFGLRVNPGDYTTAVDVVLDAQGNLIDVRVLQPSGIREFDSIVGESWKRIGRFPNPPSGLLGADGTVHTGWNFTVRVGGQSGGVEFMPPSRSY